MSKRERIAGYIDVETTGLNPEVDEIVELSLVLFRFDRETGEILEIIDEYTGLREPSVPISPGALSVNGIQEEELAGKSLDHDRITSMIETAEFLVAHNATFDRSFVEPMFEVAGKKRWYCSMRGVDWVAKGFSSRKLHILLEAHGIGNGVQHRAGADVRNAIELLSRRGSDGNVYFAEVLKSKPMRTRTERKREKKAVAEIIISLDQAAVTVNPQMTDERNGAGETEEVVVTKEQITPATTPEQPDQTKPEKPKRRIFSTILWIAAALVCVIWLGGFGLFAAGMIVSYLIFRMKRK